MNGRPRAHSSAGGESPRHDHLLRWALGILIAYLTAMLVPIAQWARESGSATALLLHLAALGAVSLAYADRLPTAIRYWTPLAVGPFVFIELRWLVIGAGRPHRDALVAGWELVAFPMDPSRTLGQAWPWTGLSELLHACYLSYYALIFVPPAVLWLKGRRSAFSVTLLALAIVYALCFAIYVIFPVDGPRFLRGAAVAPAGPVRNLVLALLASGSSRGTAFPSSHVAASLVASVCALRFQRPLGVVVSMLTAGICLGAVYGGYHYAVDIVAGLATGVIALCVARALEWRSGSAVAR
jgi:membrane-associated phospholipid phosphatase